MLTPREWEVKDLLREGLTNRQIGDRLGISLDGAKYHVSEIIGKLAVTSRLEAATWQAGGGHWWAGMVAFVGWPFKKFWSVPALKIGTCLGLAVSIGAFPTGKGVLMSDMDAAGNYDAYLVTDQGRIRLTDDPAKDMATTWSPDCSRIVFMRWAGYGQNQIWVMNADGTDQARLTSHPGYGGIPRWSPDGDQIVFVSHRDDNPEIYVNWRRRQRPNPPHRRPRLRR